MNLVTLPPNKRITTLLSLQTIQKRVETFPDDWIHENNPDQTKLKMAEAGFFYTGIRDRVQCPFCLILIELWDPGEIPIEEHMRYTVMLEKDRFIFCPFLFENFTPTINTGTGQDVTGTGTSEERDQNFGEEGREVFHTGSQRYCGSPILGDNWKLLSPSCVEGREASFEILPDKLKNMDILSLANAGFYYSGNKT